MAFRISGAAIRNPIPPLVLFAVLTLLGLVSFALLPITRAPNVDIPVVSVTVAQPGVQSTTWLAVRTCRGPMSTPLPAPVGVATRTRHLQG